MAQLLFYNPHQISALQPKPSPSLQRFMHFYAFYNGSNTTFCDRSGTITTPIRTKSLFPIPALRAHTVPLEEICNARGKEIIRRAEKLDVPVYVLWSGGIDSTLVLVSLLKNTEGAGRERITVLLTEESIIENQNFYTQHIRGTLRVDSIDRLQHLLGTRAMIVGGEGNDQLFGAGAIFRKMLDDFTPNVLHQPYDREVFRAIYGKSVDDTTLVEFYLNAYERMRDNAPLPLITNGDVAWWEKFCTKWQSVYFRSLLCVTPKNVRGITPLWLKDMYVQFYMTEDFQQWSMNNLDKRIKDTWKSYKWPCKDIIYNFTKDTEYRDNKMKWGSLGQVFKNRRLYHFIDEDLKFHSILDLTPYLAAHSDFS